MIATMEKKAIDVIICAGTHCYLMGGAELQLFGEYLPPVYKDRIKLSGSPCLDLCNNKEAGRPPFAMVNGRCIAQASNHALLEEVLKEIKKMEE